MLDFLSQIEDRIKLICSEEYKNLFNIDKTYEHLFHSVNSHYGDTSFQMYLSDDFKVYKVSGLRLSLSVKKKNDIFDLTDWGHPDSNLRIVPPVN